MLKMPAYFRTRLVSFFYQQQKRKRKQWKIQLIIFELPIRRPIIVFKFEIIQFALVVFAQMLSNFRMTMLVIGDNNFARFRCRHPSLTVKLSREIALPIFLIFSYILDTERVIIVEQ